MAKKKYKKSVILFLTVVYVLFFLLVLLISYSDPKTIKSYEGQDIYIQKTYLDKDKFGEKVYHTGINAGHFMPEYLEIPYRFTDFNFFLFDGTASLLQSAVTYVLDLMFDDADFYEEAKQNEISLHDFMADEDKSEFEFSKGNYICRLVQSRQYPRCFGVLCSSDQDKTLRYLYFEEWEKPEYPPRKEYIISCTNCPW